MTDVIEQPTTADTPDRAAEIAFLRAQLAATRAELERQEAFHASMLDAIDVAVISCGPDGEGWTRNRAGTRMLGLDADAGKHLPPELAAPEIDVFSTDGEPLTTEEYPVLRALRGEDVGVVDLRIGSAGGRHREVQTSNAQIRDHDGTLLGAVTTMTDVTAQRMALRAVAEEHRQLQEAQRIGQLGSFEHDFSGPRWRFSDELRSLWGLQLPSPDARDPFAPSLVHADDRDRASMTWVHALATAGRHRFEFRVVRADDGAERLIRCEVETQLTHTGRPSYVRGTNLDITELTAAEKAAQEARSFLEAVTTASPDLTFVSDVATGAVLWGSRHDDVLGMSTEELRAMGPSAVAAIVHPDDLDGVRAHNRSARDLPDGAVISMRYRARHSDGHWVWLSRRITPFRRDEAGVVTQVVGVLRDVTDSVAAEERLTHASTHDSLTGLPNRVLLMARLQEALDTSARSGREATVLFCDLDGFKGVNDSAGHAAGDAVLRETSRRIAGVLRDGDTVARVGGDEFVIVLQARDDAPLEGDAAAQSAADRATGLRIASRVSRAVRRPVVHEGRSHVVTASMGMTFAGGPSDGTDAESVLRLADDLMYRAKAAGKDRVEIRSVS